MKIKIATSLVLSLMITAAQADVIVGNPMAQTGPIPDLVAPMVQAVDMAAEQGGNCPLTQANKVSTQYGVTLIGSVNIPSSVASDASSLYAKNLLNFMELITNQDNGSFALNLEDEIVSGTLVSSNSD